MSKTCKTNIGITKYKCQEDEKAEKDRRQSKIMSESATESVESVPEEVRRLRAQVFQLKNIIKKLTGQEKPETEVSEDRSKKRKKERKFDFSLYKKRHVLFKVSYFGWDYHGFAVQEITGKTIESELFRALAVTRLIESRETSNYHRCGRTDKGVSAFSQIIVSADRQFGHLCLHIRYSA